jgi:hypothetical protein
VRVTRSFEALDGQTGTLVVLTSNPKTTTVKAWLNGITVLLPSVLPRSGSEEIRVPLALSEENVLELRMSAKPGTKLAFWIEDGEGPPIGGDPQPTVFRLTSQSFAPTDDMTDACTQFGEGFGMADWTEVVQAVEDGVSKGAILSDPFALILNNGLGYFTTVFPFFEDRHYALSAAGPDPQTEDSVGTEMFWLTSTTNPQPVLCVGPAP